MVHTKLTNYIPLPRSILRQGLPSTALVLYGLLLDRSTLSQKNAYGDASGWIYVVYTQEELGNLLDCSPRMIGKHIRMLETVGLLRKVRKSRKNANRYYLMVPCDAVTGTGTGTKVPAERKNQVPGTGTEVPPNNRKEQQDSINPYQHSEGESL